MHLSALCSPCLFFQASPALSSLPGRSANSSMRMNSKWDRPAWGFSVKIIQSALALVQPLGGVELQPLPEQTSLSCPQAERNRSTPVSLHTPGLHSGSVEFSLAFLALEAETMDHSPDDSSSL